VEHPLEFPPGQVAHGSVLLGPGDLGLSPPSAVGRQPGLGRDSVGDPVQPPTQGQPLANRPGPPGQDQERGLEGVLGVVFVAQDVPTDAVHERPVPLDQGGERPVVAGGREPAQKLTIAQPGRVGRDHLGQPVQYPDLSNAHARSSPNCSSTR
jgi:hypothetical protein